jgi:predicted Zn-dependent protease
VEQSPYYDKKDSPELQFRHDLIRAKLSGFLDKPEIAFNRYPSSDTTLPSIYARAIATYRQSGVDAAMPLLNKLIAEQPNWPYFYETKGQFLFESGRGAEAIAPLKKAIELAPHEAIVQIMYAQALIGTEDNRYLDEAIRNLRQALVRETSSARGYRQLATAYARKAHLAKASGAKRNFMARASLASAEAYFYEGRLDRAKQQAKRAKAGLPEGSPNWIRADDILSFQLPKKK